MKRVLAFLVIISMVLAGIMIMPGEKVFAKSKVAKVTGQEVYTKTGKAYGLIKGMASNGKTVWKYKTKKYEPVQIECFSYYVKGSKVYIDDYGKIVIVDKQTGKVKKKFKRYSNLQGMARMAVDKKGNIYIQSCMNPFLYAFSKKGELLWKKDIRKYSTSDYTGCYFIRDIDIYMNEVSCTYTDTTGTDGNELWILFDHRNGELLDIGI